MGTGANLGDVIQFGEDFEFDLRAYDLRRSGRSLKLARIPKDVLLLLEQRGQLVTREQIIERIWGKEVFVDTDNSINAAIRKIRQVLEDNPDQARFVQTVTGKGYRFIAPVQASSAAPPGVARDEPAPAVSESGPAEFQPPRQRSSRRIRQIVLGGLIVLALAAGAYLRWVRPRLRSQAVRGRVMLAVLPFENLTGDATQDYFSDGMTEEMITQLGNLDPQQLGVIARTSVMHYKGSHTELGQVGRELGVQYILEGSVRRDADKIRVTAQLIQLKDQTHLWARQYDREWKGSLIVQEELSQDIAQEIQQALGREDRPAVVIRRPKPTAEAVEAYDLCLKGQYFRNKRTAENLQRAIEYFQKAIDKDPTNARAYTGLADSYALMSGYDVFVPANVAMPKARAAALRAIELDEGLAEAHTPLAVVAQSYDWDWTTAEKEYRRAIELNPNYATAHQWYGEYLGWTGRFEEAFREMERARQLDPLSLIVATDHGSLLFYSRQYDRAIAQFREVFEMEPNFPHAHVLIYAYVQKGSYTDALAEIRKWQAIDDTPWTWATLAYVYGSSGQPAEARKALKKLEQLNQQRSLNSAIFVPAYLGMGDKDRAFAALDQSVADRTVEPNLKGSPEYDPLRSDPRFQQLLHRIGLAP